MDDTAVTRFEEVRRLRDTLTAILSNAACEDETARAIALQSFHGHISFDDAALMQKVHKRLTESAADILRPLMVDATNAVLLPSDDPAETRAKRSAANFLERASLAVLGED